MTLNFQQMPPHAQNRILSSEPALTQTTNPIISLHHPLPTSQITTQVENGMLMLTNILISIQNLQVISLHFLPIPFMHYMIILGKWSLKTNMALLLKIGRET